jgi:hypothetical protein
VQRYELWGKNGLYFLLIHPKFMLHNIFVKQMGRIHYFFAVLFIITFTVAGQAQSVRDTLIQGCWAPSIPIEVLEKADTLTLTQKGKIDYGYLEFLKDSAIMIGGNVHYYGNIRNNPYAAKLEYRWYLFGHWYPEGDTLEIFSDNIIYVCKKLSGTSANLKFIVLRRTVQYPK